MDSEIDADFYRLIHQLSLAPHGDRSAEHRRESRKPFAIRQRIAPWQGHGFPMESEFFDVQCHDLTQGGFSFFLAQRPNFTALVAEFGAPPELMYVGAQVCHFARVLIPGRGTIEPLREEPGSPGEDEPAPQSLEPRYLVGCRFTRRLQKPARCEVARQVE